MIKVKAKVRSRGPDELRKIRAACERAKGCSVTVGWLGNEPYPGGNVTVGQVAIFNEFGTYNKDGSLHTPARPFMRPALDENATLIDDVRARAIEDCAFKGKSVTNCLSMMGFTVQELVRNKIKSNVGPPNSERTTESKRRRGRPMVTLIDSRKMLDSLTFRVHLTRDAQAREDKVPQDAHGAPRQPHPGRDAQGHFLKKADMPKRAAGPGRDEHGRFLKRTP